VEPARTRAPFGLDRVRLAYGLASIALAVPCFWQSRIQAGDLASHSYNAWLAELVRSGRAPGLRVARQSTNVLFDWVLGALAAPLGPEWAERLAVALAVLVFAWGAFSFVSAVSGRRAWDLLPCIAMLAYGWVFHIGFFNFYLGLGFSLAAFALAWSGAPAGSGGARAGRGAGISVGTPRCRRIRPITAASSMSAIKRRRPPQRGHASTSNPKVRSISHAQHWPRAWRRAVSAGSASRPCSVADFFTPVSRPSPDVWRRTTSARQAARGPRTP